MKTYILFISFVLCSACSVVSKSINYDDGLQLFSLYDSDSKTLYTSGLIESRKYSFLKKFKNNKLINELIFPGQIFYIKIINDEIYGLLNAEDGNTKLVKLNCINYSILQDFGFNFDAYNDSYDISKKKDNVFVHYFSDTSSVVYSIDSVVNQKIDPHDFDLTHLDAYLEESGTEYMIQSIGSILRLSIRNKLNKNISELAIFTTKFTNLNIRLKFMDSNLLIICTSPTFQSEIWKYSLKNSEIEYLESALPIRDVLKKGNKYYATYLNSYQLYNESTSVKKIKVWKEYPF